MAHDSLQTILKRIFFLDFLSIFWCHLKVGSLFGADNSEPKIIFDLFFENVMSISNFDLENMKDQLSGQLKMLIVSYTAGQWTYNIDLLQSGYYVPFNLNFVQYLANFG